MPAITTKENKPAATAKLGAGFLAFAMRLQEASGMMNSEIVSGLSKAVRDAHKNSDQYGYYLDHNGDEDSGDCIYQCGDSSYKVPYSKGTDDSDDDYELDMDDPQEVHMVHSWEDVPEDDDHYADMEEAGLYTKGPCPLIERFVSKKERDSMDSGDFAGKGKSFPINKASDVSAAFHSLGRAGSDNYDIATIRKNIIRIAKRKGFPLPKSASKNSEAAPANARASLRLVECAAPATLFGDMRLAEAARANYPIKIISPGTGTTAHYPAAVLERDGPKVVKKGTLMFWNHATDIEEAARPEGDLDRLAAITTSDAVWRADGPKGPGLYAEAKVMADYATKVEERAPFIGLSIRGGGETTGRLVEGKPELKSLTYVESVDYVTRAGRGGMALAEAARGAGVLPDDSQGGDMDEQTAKRLIEAAVAPFKERALKGDAREEATRLLETVSLHPVAKAQIVTKVLEGTIPTTTTGELDRDKFREAVVKEAQAMGRFLAQVTGSGRVVGMGGGGQQPEPQVDAKEAERLQKLAEAQDAQDLATFEVLMGNKTAATIAAKGRAA